jgi:hypothetical protein
MDAAKAAAPYVHARLAAIEHSGETTVKYEISSEPMTVEEWKREVEAENPSPLLEAGKKV